MPDSWWSVPLSVPSGGVLVFEPPKLLMCVFERVVALLKDPKQRKVALDSVKSVVELMRLERVNQYTL